MDEKESILIVDDDESTRRSLSLIFRKKGYETEMAGTGREAIEKAQKTFFNAALLDIRLPDTDGISLLASLKGIHPDMVVIMITAYAALENAVQALNEGATAYIMKPLDMDEVLAKVGESLEKQRLARRSTDEKARLDLERIHREALRAAEVVRNLLTFARHHTLVKQYSDIDDILQKSLELRDYELMKSNIEVVVYLTHGLPGVMANFHQIQEVFLNLILNAEQAMIWANGKGKLSIKTQKIEDYIRISFTDDGPGISVEDLDKIFDPFFTTRDGRGGNGLGLSICHGIVTEHGGRIYAESKLGKWAAFVVELPVATEEEGSIA